MSGPSNAVACYVKRRFRDQQILYFVEVEHGYRMYTTYPFIYAWPLRAQLEGALLDAIMLCSNHFNQGLEAYADGAS